MHYMVSMIGWPELAVLFVIALVIYGPKRLPEIGNALGKGVKSFKDATSEETEEERKEKAEKA